MRTSMMDDIKEHGVVFMARYWLSSLLMSAAFAAMPPGRYANEVRGLIDALNWRVIDEVTRARQSTKE